MALAPDLYHGRDDTEPDEAGKEMMALQLDQAARDMSGAVDEVAAGAAVGRAASGSSASAWAAAWRSCWPRQRPDAVAAVVPCYGVIPWPDAQPDYSALDAAVLGHYAEQRRLLHPRGGAGAGDAAAARWARRRRSSSTPGPTTPSSTTPVPRSTTPRRPAHCGSAPSSSSAPAAHLATAELTARTGRRRGRELCYHRIMSARTRDLPRRSCLSTPGSNEKFLAKAPTVPADMTFLDLEDAVAPLEKESARAKVVDAIKNLPWDDRVLCVRVNAWDTEWTYGDVIEVVGHAGERLDEIMLPKVQSAAEVVALDLLLTQVEKNVGPAGGAHRHRGPDRDGPRPHQRGGDLRRLAPARDDHLRSGRLRRLHRDAGPDRRASRSPSTRATTSTTSSAGS